MKSLISFVATLIVFGACSKKSSPTEFPKLPENITGTIGYFSVHYIDLSSSLAEGSFDINASDGKHYYCEFGQISANDLNASNVNCTIKLDTTSLLSSNSVIASDTTGNAIPDFKNVVLPNNISMVFKTGADESFTRGVKQIRVSFNADTRVTYSLFNDEYSTRKKYSTDKNLCVTTINKTMSSLKGTAPVACKMGN
jgi:hypothetical protein